MQQSPGESSSPGSAHLAYLGADTPGVREAEEAEGDEQMKRARSPEEEKRDGAFFEDLDLGLVVEDDEVRLCLVDLLVSFVVLRWGCSSTKTTLMTADGVSLS